MKQKTPTGAAEIRLLTRLYQLAMQFPEGDERARYLRRTHDYLWDRCVEQPKRDAARAAADNSGEETTG